MSGETSAPRFSISGSYITIGDGDGHQIGNQFGTPPEPPELRRDVWKWIVGVATVAGTLIAAFTLYLALSDGDGHAKNDLKSSSTTTPSDLGTQTEQPNPPPSILPSVPPVYQVEARVQKTWDVASNAFVGVESYADPGPNGRGTEVGHYPEKGTIAIICYRPDGRKIADAAWRDRELASTIWYKLGLPNEQWIPGLYVGFPSTANGRRPADMPEC